MPIRPRSPLAVVAFALACAMPLAARAQDRAGPPGRRPQETLFISPAGEPFRGQTGQPYPVAAWFAGADTNHDGRLDRDEFRADFARFFKLLDTDHNGVVDGVEIASYEQDVAPEVLPRLAQAQSGDFTEGGSGSDSGSGPPGSGGRRGGGTRRLAQAPARKGKAVIDGAPEFSLLNIAEPVSNADTNFDGKVSLQEFLAAADRRFDELDPSRQDYLTLDGLPRTPEQTAVDGRRKPPK